MTTATKYPLAILAGLSLVGGLTACTATATGTGIDTPTGTEAGAPAGAYADGTYTETGDYQAPSGTESVEVTITLAGGIVTAVEVVGGAEDPQAKIYQGKFIGGIAGVVVGKTINDIQVDKVGGSSLTSGGFNKAADAIRADAAA